VQSRGDVPLFENPAPGASSLLDLWWLVVPASGVVCFVGLGIIHANSNRMRSQGCGGSDRVMTYLGAAYGRLFRTQAIMVGLTGAGMAALGNGLGWFVLLTGVVEYVLARPLAALVSEYEARGAGDRGPAT
jgi:hypothetical protein